MIDLAIISDKKWIDKNKKYLNKFKLISVDTKIDVFSNKIEEEIKNVNAEYISIINPMYDLNIDVFKKIIRNIRHDNILIYSNDLKNVDFSLMDNNSFIVIPKKQYKIINKKFNNILEYTKNIISYFVDNPKIEVIGYNKEMEFSVLVDQLRKKNKKIDGYNKRITKNKHIYDPKKYKNMVFSKSNKIKKISLLEDKELLTCNKEKPDVLLVCDVKGWAWWLKSHFLKKYLSEFYNIDVVSVIDDRTSINYGKYDLCFTYGYSYINRIKNVNIKRRFTGITAHRPLEILNRKMNEAYWTHANSVLLYKDLEKIHNNPFYVPNGVDLTKFFLKTPLLNERDNFIFGHVGKKSNRKGQMEFLEPAVNKAGVKYLPHYNNYKSRIPHDKMIDVHHNYDIFMIASEEDGTPCGALEAAACGRPIISNKIGNMPELIENYKTGILLEKRDIDLYVDAIKWCNDNPEKVIEMGKNIQKKIIEEWDWKILSKNYLLMFDKALNIKRDFSVYDNPSLYHIDGYLERIGYVK